MAWGRAAVGLVVAVVLAALLVSGGPRDESFRLRSDPGWLARARPLGPGAPRWAQRMYRRSLLVLRELTDRDGAAVAGPRDGWEYVWPRDASAVAMAFAAAGYRAEARRVVDFLLGLDLRAAARFQRDGTPVGGRAAQGDAVGWVAAAARAAGVQADVTRREWRDRADYQEGEAGDYLGNAIASVAAAPEGTSAGDLPARRLAEEEIWKEFGVGGVLVREAGEGGSGVDSAAAWAIEPFPLPSLYPLARRTLLRIAARSSRYGIFPSEDWDGGVDPWTAPAAWTAWSLAALGERRASLRLMAALRRDATAAGFLPERVDARTGIPASTTPLAWSHAFAILALQALWP